MGSGAGIDQERDPGSDSDAAPVGRAVRVFATLAALALVGSYVAAQIDFIRRHQPGIAPLRYWLPQARTIWAPGLAMALICAGAALALHRWRRGK
jgi:hypothetical protein